MKYISYYELIKEMAEEEGIKLRDENGLDEKVLDEFKKNKRRHFRNIAKQVGNLEHFSYLRKKRYRIPIEDKEAIKYQLRQETKPLLKKVKKRLNAKLTLDHIVDMDHIKEELRSVLKQRLQQANGKVLEDIISSVVDFLKRSDIDEVAKRTPEQDEEAIDQLTEAILGVIKYRIQNPITHADVDEVIQPVIYKGVTRCSEEKQRELRNIMCTSYQLYTRGATDYVIDAMKGLMERDIGHMLGTEIHHNRKTAFIKDEDSAWLVYWYLKMMDDQSRRWNKMYDIIADLRMEEFCQHAETGRLEMLESPNAIKRAYATLLEEEQEIPIRFNKIEKIPAEQREQLFPILKEAIAKKQKRK